MLRLIHNRSIVKYFLAALGVAFAFYFAWSFYPFGEWVGQHFLERAPGGPSVLGWASASIMIGCVLVVVFYKEYLKEDSAAYSLATGDASFMKSFIWFTWAVLGLELFSVLFRAILLNFSSVAWVILGVGVIGMFVTYIVGKQLHVQMNRPPELAARYMREEAQRSVFEEGHRMTRPSGFLWWKKPSSFTIGQRRKIGAGDPQPIDDVRDEQAAEREREVEKTRARDRVAEEKQRKDREFYENMVAPPPDTHANNGNGHRPKQSTGFPS